MKKRRTSWTAIAMVLVVTLMVSAAQLLWKTAADTLELTLLGIITNLYLVGGGLIYLVAVVLLLKALKKGELSVLYPFIATSYVWVSILSRYFLNEPMNIAKWSGVVAIVAGVSLIGAGGE